MRLLNIGERTFITPYGKWEPMEIIAIPEDKADFYLGYTGEVKVLEEAVAEVAIAEDKPAKKQKKGK